jgi:hypothetical protein
MNKQQNELKKQKQRKQRCGVVSDVSATWSTSFLRLLIDRHNRLVMHVLHVLLVSTSACRPRLAYHGRSTLLSLALD